MIYYKRALQEDEYEIAIGEKATPEQIIKANEKLKNWADPPKYKVENIVENNDKPSIEKLVLLRQIKLIMDSPALVENGNRGGSTLYDILVRDFDKNAKAIEEIDTFAKSSQQYGVSEHAVQEWDIKWKYSRILREDFVEKHTEYLDIRVEGTKFKRPLEK